MVTKKNIIVLSFSFLISINTYAAIGALGDALIQGLKKSTSTSPLEKQVQEVLGFNAVGARQYTDSISTSLSTLNIKAKNMKELTAQLNLLKSSDDLSLNKKIDEVVGLLNKKVDKLNNADIRKVYNNLALVAQLKGEAAFCLACSSLQFASQGLKGMAIRGSKEFEALALGFPTTPKARKKELLRLAKRYGISSSEIESLNPDEDFKAAYVFFQVLSKSKRGEDTKLARRILKFNDGNIFDKNSLYKLYNTDLNGEDANNFYKNWTNLLEKSSNEKELRENIEKLASRSEETMQSYRKMMELDCWGISK